MEQKFNSAGIILHCCVSRQIGNEQSTVRRILIERDWVWVRKEEIAEIVPSKPGSDVKCSIMKRNGFTMDCFESMETVIQKLEGEINPLAKDL
jgi:hypothetical protein